MQNILMIAFHYPPCHGSSGVQRTLKFSRYLPDCGWQPVILTANPKAYSRVGDDQLGEIPQSVPVRRAFALDTSRHLAIHGVHLRWMALPDRWVSWWLGAVPSGLRLVKKYGPAIIWSTYPIATAHLIGMTLHRLTGIPWVADFRDSMTEDEYPPDVLSRRSYRWIERQAIQYSSRLIFTTRLTREMYLNRYPQLLPERCLVIANGYDEEDFKDFTLKKPLKDHNSPLIRLVHAGALYPQERDPRPFFKVLSRLKTERRLSARDLRVELRASGEEGYYATVIRQLGIDDLVHLLPPLPYRQALQDCADADALLLFQAASCDHQIPAKVYEYLRLQKPILALTTNRGETAALLGETGGATIVDLQDEHALYSSLPRFLRTVSDSVHPLPNDEIVRRYTRKNQAYELGRFLSQLVR